jgi:hypothetical protein
VDEQYAAAGRLESYIQRQLYGQVLSAQKSPSSTCRGQEKDVPDFLSIVANASHNLLWIVIKGGMVMIPLLTSSVIALTVIVERLCFWRRLCSHTVYRIILTLVAEGDLPQAMQVASTARHPVARMFYAGIAAKHLSPGTAM